MRILFTADRYLPDTGGLQMSTHQLARRLQERGHEVAVLTRLPSSRSLRLVMARARRKLLRRPFLIASEEFGYVVFAAALPSEGITLARERFAPDVIVVNGGGELSLPYSRAYLRGAGDVPSVLYVRDVHSVALVRAEPAIDLVVTNAVSLSDMVRERGVDAPTVPSVIETDECLAVSTRRKVLFINPVSSRGVEIAWEVARRRPDIPFAFQESWLLPPSQVAEILRRAEELDNVEFRRARRAASTIYSDARILLVPYLIENRPRVVQEAQANAIPVIAMAGGGLIEATGSGGILVGREAPIDEWVQALSTLWDDPAAYERYSRAALDHSQRDEVRPEAVAALFERIIAPVADRRGAGSE